MQWGTLCAAVCTLSYVHLSPLTYLSSFIAAIPESSSVTSSLPPIYRQLTTRLPPAYYQFTTSLPPAYHPSTTSLPPVYPPPVYYQFTTSLPPAYHQLTTSLPPIYYQFTTSLPPIYHHFSTSQFLTMSSTVRRGRAYHCMKCDWVGERSYGQQHYAKCHATVTPFWCKTCDYRVASERQIAMHQKQKKHVTKTKDNQEEIAYTPGVRMSTWLRELSAEESKAEWRCRGHTPTPESSSSSTLAIDSVPDPDPAPPQTIAPVSQAEVAEASDILEKINQRIDSERQAIANLKKKKQERRPDPPKPKRKGDDLEGEKTTKQPRGSSLCGSGVSSLSVSSKASEGSMVVEAPVQVPTTHCPEPREEDFIPDYEEGTSRQSEAAKSDVKKLVQLAVKEVAHDLHQSLVERPSVVATSVMAVTHQLIANNHLLTDVDTRLKEAQPGPDTQMSVQLKHVLGDVHAELKQLNRSRVAVNRSSAELTSAVREMSSVLRSFTTTLQTSMTAMNAGVQAILGAKTPGLHRCRNLSLTL